MVRPPMRESFRKSASEATPVMSEPSTSGTAISNSNRRKIVPNGVIQSAVKRGPAGQRRDDAVDQTGQQGDQDPPVRLPVPGRGRSIGHRDRDSFTDPATRAR